MQSESLRGRMILIVEDEPLVALDISDSFEAAGAIVVTARTLPEALRLADHPDLSAAVLDFSLGDGDAEALCAKLKDRGLPFVIYSGYSRVHGACSAGTVIPKPANPGVLVTTLAGMLG